MMASAPPFTLAEFGELVSAALEEVQERNDPERTHTTLSCSRRSFLSFSCPRPRRPALASPPQARSFFISSPTTTMLHTPLPLHSIDAMSHLDLTQHCIPLPSPTTPSRPRARQVLDRLKRQASALVKSPTSRLRSVSCSQPGTPPPADSSIPTVTLVSATSVHSSSSGRSRSVSCACDDDRSTGTATLRIEAPSGGDFMPYLPLAVQLERERHVPRSTDRLGSADGTSFRKTSMPSAPGYIHKRRLVPPSSPSPSERSDSTVSTRSPATPIFPQHTNYDVHPYASVASVLHRWSTGSDDRQNSDPFAKSKLRVVRRSLIQDSFLQACAAAGDVPSSPVSALGDDGSNPSKKRPSAFKKKSTASLPPLKPPPSCPLPSPPLTITSDDSDCSLSSLDKPRDAAPAADEEWTLYLGAPSQPLELSRDIPKKEIARGRSGSSPSIYSTKQHLSPEDIPPQIQHQNQPRLRTTSNLSTRSSATTRRIESGPAPNLPTTPAAARVGNEDWTLSLPLLKKPKSSLCIDSTKKKEVVVVAGARKCKSFAEWTTNLPDELEKLRELEREQKRERKASKASVVSASSGLSQRSASQAAVKLKRQLPIGPGSSSPCTPSSPSSPIGAQLTPSRSTISLRSMASTTSMASTSSYISASGSLYEQPPSSPSSPSTPSSGLATFTYAGTISASTSVSTLSKFPLPPSFSSKLLQRRQAAPPMPKPLLPACAFASAPPPSSSAPLRNVSTYSPIEPSITSAPATTSYFPAKKLKLKPKLGSGSRSRSRSKEIEDKGKGKGKEEGNYFPPSTASSTSSSSSSSVRTVSSTATIVPGRTQQQRLMTRIEELEAKMVLDISSSSSSGFVAERDGGCGRGERRRDSLGSSVCEGEFDTCTEGEMEMDAVSMVSEVYYSARSSLNM